MESGPPVIALLMSAASPWSIDIALALTTRGLCVRVLTRSDPAASSDPIAREGAARLLEANIPISWPTGWRARLPSLAAMALHVRQIATGRCIHVFSLYGGMQATAAVLSCKRPHSIYWVGSDLLRQSAWKAPIIRLLIRSARHNLVNGLHMLQKGEAAYGIAGLRNHYIGVDTADWKSDLTHQPGSIICTRWFETVYANDVIIDAAALLQERGHVLSLCFTSSGSLLAEAQMRARQLGVSDIEFLGGVTREQLHARVAVASLYVSMSQSDGTSTALLEAMAMGLFPIISDIDANREWITTHGCDGLLVPVGDAAALADGIEQILNDPQRIVAARERNRQIVERLADSRRNAALLADILIAESGKDK